MSRIAIITAASRGIGAATALLAAGRGYSVCVHYRRHEAAAARVVAAVGAFLCAREAVQRTVEKRGGNRRDVIMRARVLRLGVWASAIAAISILRAQPHAVGPGQLIGTWRGTSLCTDRIAAPACRDETVVYEFTAGSKPGTVQWIADKVVNGQRERMYELDLAYDTTEACWKAEFSSPRVRGVWRLTVDGARLAGTGHLLPGNQMVRKIAVRKE
jgi:hypothetical protein